MRTTTALGIVVGLVALTGCPNRPQAPLPAPAPATITSFTASPATVHAGSPVQLAWGTSNASDVTIEHVGHGPLDLGASKTAGTLSVTVDADAIFLITAQGAGGSDVRSAAVTVQRKARSVLFTAVPSTIEAGGTATLVWNAAGATSIKLEEVGGGIVPIGTQLESGSVQVSVTKTTSYRLTADEQVSTAELKVAPTITSFTAGGAVPAAGEQVTLRWEASAVSSVTLRRVGLGMPLTTASGAGAESGSFTDTVPTTLPADAILQYVLEASDGTATISKAVEVPVGGGVRITSFTAPSYALSGTTFQVSWTTAGADSAELIVDGRRAYLAQSRAEVSIGSYSLPAPTQSTRVELVVRSTRGAEARDARTVEGVGALAYNFFRADKGAIAAGGEPVRLEWSVTNARTVKITNNAGGGFYRQFTGNVDTGSLVVLPNARTGLSRITYRLEADNGTGAPSVVRTIDVDVASESAFTFSRQLPIRAPTTVTGSAATGTTQVAGFKNVEKNPAGEAFVDIRRTGTPVVFSSTSTASNFLLPAAFDLTLFGTRRSATRLNVSQFGWFVPTTSSTVAVGRPDNDATIGTILEPLSVVPYWRNLVTANGQVHWQIDGVADARRLIVQWSNVRPSDGPLDARLTFQAQVYSNGKVVFAYRDFFKVQGNGTVGVVNGSESDETSPSMPVAAGDVYRFFAPQALPAALRIEATPYAGAAIVNGEWMEAEGQASFPVNLFFVSEVNHRPSAAVTNGFWFEVTSSSDAGLDLGGWDIDFGGVQQFAVPMGTVLPAFGTLLFGQSADLGDPNASGVGFPLPDGGTELRRSADVTIPSTFTPPNDGFIRLGIAGNEYSRFPGAGTLPNNSPLGQSYMLENRMPYVQYSNTTGRFVCPSMRYRYGQNGQLGTPGLTNVSCFPYDAPVGSSRAFQPLAGVGTPIAFADSFGPDPDDGVAVINLTTPVQLFGQATSVITAGANGGVLPYSATSFTFSNRSTPSTSSPNFVIAPFWDDLNGSTTGTAYWLQESNGDVIVSWEDWGFYSGTGVLNFQVVLHANGDVEFVYGSMSGTNGQGQSATSWIDISGGTLAAAAAVNVNSAGITPNSAYLYVLGSNR